MLENIAKLLNSKEKLLTEIYFDLQLFFEEKYGKNTIVFMEIGSFFETYEVNNETHQIGKAKEVSELLNIQLTRKNKSIIENSLQNPLLAGIPAVSLERYLSRLAHKHDGVFFGLNQTAEVTIERNGGNAGQQRILQRVF